MSETMDQPLVTSRKSVTCRYFAASGTCFYGEECQFLHTTIKPSRLSHYGVSNISSTSTIHSKDPALEEASVNRNNSSENYFGGGANEEVDNFKERNNVTYTFDETVVSNNVFPSFKEGASGATYFFSPKEQLQPQALMNNLEDGKLSMRSDKSALSIGTSTRMQTEGRSALMSDMSDAFTKLSMESYNGHKRPSSYFMPEDLKSDIIYRNALSISTVEQSSFPGLPQEVDHYNELVPLEAYCLGRAVKSSSYGLITSTYKATHTKTGLRYCLKRIHGYKLSSPRCLALVDLWKKLKHCHVATLCEVFTTKAFGDNSMIFAYEYYPGAETLMDKYFSPSSSSSERHVTDLSVPRPYSSQKSGLSLHSATNRGMITESTLWSFIIQMCSALRAVHAAGLAFRGLDASKVLVMPGNRIRLNGGGIMDVLGFDSQMVSNSSMMAHFQQEDLLSLGKLLLSLGCNSLISLQRDNLTSSVEYVSKHYSSDFRNLIIYLLTSTPGSRLKNIQEVMPIIGARFFGQLESVVQYSDTLEDYLSRELDNGRLFRLLAKLGSVVDRPELNMDSNWSETGDRYLLKLFQDYVLHPSTDDGRPWVDLAHIISCLNRLDTASQDKICLTSRDHQNVLVVSYAELHQCLEASFAELQQAAIGAIPVTNPIPDSDVQ